MAVNQQGGSAILFLFIAVALFGALSYVFLQGSRGSTTMITNEAAKAASYQTQDCANAVSMATKRLNSRGCGTLISSAADGSNPVAGAPADGSCSVFHPNGGGVKPNCAPTPPAAPDPCLTGPVGTACTTDGAIYVGSDTGVRVYLAPSDEPGTFAWKTSNTDTAGTSSMTNGVANTAAMIAAGAAAHPAANACYTKAPTGTWYLPADSEFSNLMTNRIALGPLGLGMNNYHLTSKQRTATTARAIGIITTPFAITMTADTTKTTAKNVRCFRQ